MNYLSPCFDGTRMFVFSPVGNSSSHTKAKSIDGMNKRYDGHVWTKIHTTTANKDLDFILCSSTFVGHLQGVQQTSPINDIDGFTK